MSALSYTPETDAMIQPFDGRDCVTGNPIPVVHADDCRSLERRLADAVRERDEAKEDAERLATALDFILNECDWEENSFGKSGDNRIGTVCKEALKYK